MIMIKRLIISGLLVSALAGCSTLNSLTGQTDNTVLPGKREEAIPGRAQFPEPGDTASPQPSSATSCQPGDPSCPPADGTSGDSGEGQ
jgi:hypothetical protein